MSEFNPQLSVFLNTSLYPQAAIVRTCYALAHTMHIESAVGDGENIVVNIQSLTTPRQNDEEIRVIFFRSLNDFCLRHAIEQKTKNIRDAIITSALLEAVPAQNEKS